MNEQAYLPKNEIDTLRNVFIQYRLFITIITFFGVVLSTIYALWIYKPLYSASALIQIGKLNGRLIEDSRIVETKLLDKYEVYINTTTNTLPKISAIKIVKISNGILRVTAIGNQKIRLKKYLKSQVFSLSSEHNISLSEYISEYRNKLILAEKSLRESRENYKNIKLDISRNNKNIDALTNTNQTLANIYIVKMLRNDVLLERTYAKMVKYKKHTSTYTKYLMKSKTFPTKIIDHVVMQKKPITPSRSMVIVLGFISSLFFSVLMAFFASFVFVKND